MRKKWLAGIFIFAFLAIVSSAYIFIPDTLVVSSYTLMRSNPIGSYRVISQEAFWDKWQEGKDPAHTYQLSGKFYNAIDLVRKGSGASRDSSRVSRMTIFPLPHVDSIALQWECSFPSGRNPLTRIRQYEEAKDIKKNMTSTLAALQSFLENKKNVYGLDVNDAMSKDSTLVATKLYSASYPSTPEIYRMIGRLRSYIAGQGARETGHPMLHVQKNKTGDKPFETMVAIPVNTRLTGNASIFLKLYVPWKVLIGEVKGGPSTAEHALEQLQQYVSDYQRTAMAIPFQSLVTERNREPDTSRWITRVVQAVD